MAAYIHPGCTVKVRWAGTEPELARNLGQAPESLELFNGTLEIERWLYGVCQYFKYIVVIRANEEEIQVTKK